MGFSNRFLLLVSVAFLGLLVKQSEAGLPEGGLSAIRDTVAQRYAALNKQFDSKAKIGGDGNLIISLAQKDIADLEASAALHTRAGIIGEAIRILKNGWEYTIKLVADALDEAFDLIDNVLSEKINNKEAALNAFTKGINIIKKGIYHSGAPVHASLGSAQSLAKYADKGGLKYAIGTIQECGTELFEALQVAEFFAIQGLNADDEDVKGKCRKAAHSAIMSAALAANDFLMAGAGSAMKYLANANAASIVKHEPVENIISEKAKQAAAADSDTVEAIAALNVEFEDAIKKGISAPILKVLKEGLLEYIDHSAWSVAISYDALAQAKVLAKSDPQAAISAIRSGIESAKSVLIYGSVKAYEGLGAAGRLSGQINGFQDAIEIVEQSRVEGTKGMDAAEKLAVRAIKSGGPALEQTLDSAHLALEAVEAIIFEQLHETRALAFKLLKP